MQYLLIAPILAALYWLYLKIRALFLVKKDEAQTEKLKELKDESAKKTNDADTSYEHTLELYKQYKAGKPDSDKP